MCAFAKGQVYELDAIAVNCARKCKYGRAVNCLSHSTARTASYIFAFAALEISRIAASSLRAKINSLEHELFSEIRERIKSITDILQKTAKNVAALDMLTSYAHVSQKLGFVKPDVHDRDRKSVV